MDCGDCGYLVWTLLCLEDFWALEFPVERLGILSLIKFEVEYDGHEVLDDVDFWILDSLMSGSCGCLGIGSFDL